MTHIKLATLAVLAALVLAPLGSANGSFHSSDPQLDAIWAASVRTAAQDVIPGPLSKDLLGRPCPIDEPVVIVDGVTGDRCPYIGDDAVTGMTLLVSTPSAARALKDEILWFARAQKSDGIIPASPLFGGLLLFDYPSYWVQCLYDDVLYTGDTALAKTVWPHLVKLMDTWYPSRTQSDGLIVNNLGASDYAYIPRSGPVVAYYNAGYVYALERAATIAEWIGKPLRARRWLERARALEGVFNGAFWDPSAGTYRDTTTGAVVHSQDSLVFAVLAGLASSSQASSALAFETRVNGRYRYGDTIADNNVWSDADSVWGIDAKDIVEPFIGYFELVDEFEHGMTNSALNLIRREWGYMLANGPKTTMWPEIGPFGSPPEGPDPTFEHGWSSGAAPALTNFTVLGVRPTSPGFKTFIVDPHPGSAPSWVWWASGSVPTPHGNIVDRLLADPRRRPPRDQGVKAPRGEPLDENARPGTGDAEPSSPRLAGGAPRPRS